MDTIETYENGEKGRKSKLNSKMIYKDNVENVYENLCWYKYDSKGRHT